MPVDISLEMLPFSGNLDFQCTVSHALSSTTSWKWHNVLTDPATTRPLGSSDASIATETLSECKRRSRLTIPTDFLSSGFEYGAMMCEADGQSKKIVIEEGNQILADQCFYITYF